MQVSIITEKDIKDMIERTRWMTDTVYPETHHDDIEYIKTNDPATTLKIRQEIAELQAIDAKLRKAFLEAWSNVAKEMVGLDIFSKKAEEIARTYFANSLYYYFVKEIVVNNEQKVELTGVDAVYDENIRTIYAIATSHKAAIARHKAYHSIEEIGHRVRVAVGMHEICQGLFSFKEANNANIYVNIADALRIQL
jgi:hypothetical protein